VLSLPGSFSDNDLMVVMQDGNTNTLMVQQEMNYTDFTLAEITLLMIGQGEHMVAMLPAEY